MKILKSTPREDGFRMPGEFEKHAGCWMLWPEREDNWRLGAKPAQHSFAEVAELISKFEPVRVGVSVSQYANARKMLSSNIEIVKIPHDDSWVRDSGPDFVINQGGEIRGIDWNFNAYGGTLYPSWKKDKLVAKKIIKFEKTDCYESKLTLEGGSICVDGEGTLITTEECLLNPNRNFRISKKQIEKYLKEYLNLKKIIWLKRGMYMDEAGGHIDNLCCFAKPGTVLLLWTNDKSDPQHEISKQAYQVLKSQIDASGRKLKIYLIHQSHPKYRTKKDIGGVKRIKGVAPRNLGDRLPASYINFYIANGGIIMPIFKDPYDKPAFNMLKKLFPDRKVIKINSHEIILGGGGIHCITKNIPKAMF